MGEGRGVSAAFFLLAIGAADFVHRPPCPRNVGSTDADIPAPTKIAVLCDALHHSASNAHFLASSSSESNSSGTTSHASSHSSSATVPCKYFASTHCGSAPSIQAHRYFFDAPLPFSFNMRSMSADSSPAAASGALAGLLPRKRFGIKGSCTAAAAPGWGADLKAARDTPMDAPLLNEASTAGNCTQETTENWLFYPPIIIMREGADHAADALELGRLCLVARRPRCRR